MSAWRTLRATASARWPEMSAWRTLRATASARWPGDDVPLRPTTRCPRGGHFARPRALGGPRCPRGGHFARPRALGGPATTCPCDPRRDVRVADTSRDRERSVARDVRVADTSRDRERSVARRRRALATHD